MRYDSGCCDAERDARAMGYRNAREADADNWGNPDADYKAISGMHITQIDHLCGNSICVGVLESIFSNLLIPRN